MDIPIRLEARPSFAYQRKMKRIVVFIGALLLVPAAACDKGEKPAPTKEAKPKAKPGTVKVGSEVVAGVGKTGFREGKIVAIDGTKATLEYGRENKKTGKRPTLKVDLNRTFLKGQVKAVKKGEHLACQVSTTSWYACRVESVTGKMAKTEDSYGKSHNLNLNALVRPDAATQANIKDYLIKEAKRRAFDKAFLAAGKPVTPAGWTPKKGAKIVIHFVGTSWYGGTVVKNKEKKGKVRIDWEGDTWKDRDVSPTEVAPQPASAQSVKAGQFVIVRPRTASMRWEHAKVLSVKGTAVEVINRDEKKSMTNTKDIVPIAP